MAATGGYHGKVARVDLSANKVSIEPVDELLCRRYIGGAGFVAHHLLKEVPPGADAFSAENRLIFANGPFSGLSIPGAGRHCVGAKSPLTGGVAKSEAGEFFGAELKRAGLDGLIVQGRADKPVYLWVHDGEIEIRDAAHLWGKSTKETQDTIRAEVGDNAARLSVIGPAGENMVRFACIMTGLFDAAGRGGLGAVMGSKNLKAVVARGRKPLPVADPEAVKVLRAWLLENRKLMQSFSDFGTGGIMVAGEQRGNLPVRNFRDGLFPGTGKIDAVTIKNTARVGMDGCFACLIRCKKVVKLETPYAVDPAYGGPEYETLAALGSNCGVDDLPAICKANEICGAYSLDTISTGGVIAFAMECFEKGILTRRDTAGIDLRFGNAEAMLQTVEAIARRQGIGDLLAEGTRRAAERLGKEAVGLAVHVKGLDPGMHEPRLKPALGLGYMVNPHGADHGCNLHDDRYAKADALRQSFGSLGWQTPLAADDIGPRKVALFRDAQARSIILDCLLVCSFFPYTMQQLVETTAGITGWNTGAVEQLRVAERIITAMRLFNVRHGLTADEDRLPDRFFSPKTDGVLSHSALDPARMEQAKRYYYTLMGWDERGVPRPEKIVELELE